MATSFVSIAVAEKKARSREELVAVKQNTDPSGTAGRQVLPTGMVGQLPVQIDHLEEKNPKSFASKGAGRLLAERPRDAARGKRLRRRSVQMTDRIALCYPVVWMR